MNYLLQKAALLFFLVIAVNADAQIITRIAGNGYGAETGSGGYTGDGGVATSAELNYPWSVAVDDSGNTYIADVNNNRIRKVNASTGIITTFAGTGAGGFSGDGGSAALAKLNYPTAIALDTFGNLYIGDRLNSRIREITIKTGIINTIAGSNTFGGFAGDGGPATAAKLDQPYAMAIDDSGNIYFSDYGNNRIRKITAATGIINTIAGNGKAGFAGDGGLADSAKLNFPLGVAVDKSGNVYIGDYINNRIRKVTASTGIISTIAGDGAQGYYGDGGPATAAEFYHTEGVAVDDSANVYIADYYNNVVRKITAATGIINLFAGDTYGAGAGYGGSAGDGGPATLAQLWGPTGLTVDAQGDVYIADNYNNLIRKVTACPKLSINPASPAICEGEGVTLVVSENGTNFTWSPAQGLNATTGDTVFANPNATTTYTVTEIANSCTMTGTDVVTILPIPNKPTITVSVTGDSLISSTTQGNQWYFNDTLINGATSQVLLITGQKKGYYSVMVINPANGCSATSDSTSGVNQVSIISEQLAIYPNPTSGNIIMTINASVQMINDWNLKVTDVLGRTLITKLSLNYSNDIDLADLPNGIYFIIVDNKGNRGVFPIVKQ